LIYWTCETPAGVFSIVEPSSRGADLFFGQDCVGHYGNAALAAEELAKGNHPALSWSPQKQQSVIPKDWARLKRRLLALNGAKKIPN
jgi:hypothetical protein